MKLTVLAGPANRPLAEGIARKLELPLGRVALERFPDGEAHVVVDASVRGHDVYLVQPTGPPVDERIMELLLLADACGRAGAARVTAVVPYYGYARQDRRKSGREPISARLVADLIRTSGIARVVAVDVHTAALEGFFGIPLEVLSATRLLADAVRSRLPRRAVVVAPDLGAVKLAERFAKLLDLPVAVVPKVRLSGSEVRAQGVLGDVRDLAPMIVDDMISTGGTIEAAIRALAAAGACAAEVTVVATHALLVGPAAERLEAAGVRRLIATNSVAAPSKLRLTVETVDLAPLLAEAIRRLHGDESLSDLIRTVDIEQGGDHG
jgi:ribose-phosphate pyrophosphokinase